jgi:hypothetical protein
MKQKYSIVRDTANRQLIIREFAELDKEIMSLLCEETYEDKTVSSAIKSGKEDLIAALRTKNLYPPGIYAEKIADTVVEIYASKDKESVDLFFDDNELLIKEQEAAAAAEKVEEESTDLDEVLEDEFEESYEDKEDISKLDSSLKIADDDYVNGDEES